MPLQVLEQVALQESRGDEVQANQGPSGTLVVELRGDSFLAEQPRRVIGSAIAVHNGWLPADFWSQALRRDAMLETALAPPGRLYLSRACFAFADREKKLSLPDPASAAIDTYRRELQSQLAG